jgi:hypothetical protein
MVSWVMKGQKYSETKKSHQICTVKNCEALQWPSIDRKKTSLLYPDLHGRPKPEMVKQTDTSSMHLRIIAVREHAR